MRFIKSQTDSDTIAFGGVLIAALSTIYSIYSFSITKEQFNISNQAYLRVVPYMDLVNNYVDHDKKVIANDTMEFNGVNIYFNLINTGNVPTKYTLKEFHVTLDGKKLPSMGLDNESSGIVYPDQNLRFNCPTYSFDKYLTYLKFSVIKKLTIQASVKFEYVDLNSNHVKTVDRDINFKITPIGIEGGFIEFRDKI